MKDFFYEEFFPEKRDDLHFMRYKKFIFSREKRELEKDGFEKHHIVPRSFLPSNKKNRDENNVIYLSYKEHFIAHMILWKAFGGKMAHAFYFMSHPNSNSGLKENRLTVRQYEQLKLDYSSRISEILLSNWQDEEYREKMSKKRKETWKRESYRKKMISIARERLMTEDEKKKISEGQLRNWKDNKERKLKLKKDSRNWWKDEEYKNRMIESFTGRIGITDGKCNKFVKESDLEYFLNNGFRRGIETKNKDLTSKKHSERRKSERWVNDGSKNYIVKDIELEDYLKNGYYKGMIRRKKK